MEGIVIKKFTFEAAHYLEGHLKCGKIHGHSWELKISVEGTIKENGFVMDFHDLKDCVEKNVLFKLDHNFLNEEFDFKPTCENLSVWIWKQLEDKLLAYGVKLIRVKLAETKNNYFAYYGK